MTETLKKTRTTDPRITRIRSIKQLNVQLKNAHVALEVSRRRIDRVHAQISVVLKETSSAEESDFLRSLIEIPIPG